MFDEDLREIADRAATASRQPDFEVLARHGRMRRRREAVAAGVSVLVVLGAVAAGAATLGNVDRGAPPPATHTTAPPIPGNQTPSPSPSQSPAPRRQALATPEQVVRAPNARLIALSVSPHDPSTKAAIWTACHNAGRPACAKPVWALVVTSDDFAHPHYVSLADSEDVYPTLTALNGGGFFVGRRSLGPPGMIVSAEGTVRQVHLTGIAPSALKPTEQLVSCPPSRKTEPCVLGLDVATGTAHGVPTSDNGPERIEQTPGVGLWSVGVGTDPTHLKPVVLWSSDGGAHWSRYELTGLRDLDTVQPMPSGADRTIAVAAGSIEDVFIVHSFHRSTDSGATWQSFSLDANGVVPVVDWSVVRPDGTLVIDTEDWIGLGVRSKEHVRPKGIYVSNGTDWSEFSRVTAALPSDVDPVSYWGNQLLDARMDGAGHQSLYVTGYTTAAPVLVSTDGGRTWAETPAR